MKHSLVYLPSLCRFTGIVLACMCARDPAAQTGGTGGGPAPGCCMPPGNNSPCCIGAWDAMPHNPPISCGAPDDPTCLLAGCQDDEIAHAALIPSGAWPLASPEQTQRIAGMVLVWTRCDKRSAYTTHV
jgi:hypothetical protein